MDVFSTPAIVLRVRDTDTADRLAVLLTPARGRLVCAAKNARRSFKRFGGCLTLFAEIQAEAVAIEDREIARLESAVLLEPFEGIRRGWRPLAVAAAGTELVDRIAHGAEEAPALYAEMRAFLAATADPLADAARTLSAFELRVLALAGFRPELDLCVRCGRGVTRKAVTRTFDVHRGGLVCPACVAKHPSPGRRDRVLAISDAARAALAAMLAGAAPPDIPAKVHAECAGLVNALITERLGAPLKTWSVR